MSSYLRFNGEELTYFEELKEVFKLMNHKDQLSTFGREINIFRECKKGLTQLHSNNKNGPPDQNHLTVGRPEESFSDVSSKQVSQVDSVQDKVNIQQIQKINPSPMRAFCGFISKCFGCLCCHHDEAAYQS